MLKLKYLSALLALFLAGYLAAQPYLVATRISDAAERHDSQTLARYVDFERVRLSLKAQFNNRVLREMGGDIKQNPFAALGASVANMMVEGLVDTYMTPNGIEQLIRGDMPAPGIPHKTQPRKTPSADEPHDKYERSTLFSDARMRYTSLNTFVVTVQDEDGDEADFILRRNGLEWQLTDILLPLD